jgi:hypothetical protein
VLNEIEQTTKTDSSRGERKGSEVKARVKESKTSLCMQLASVAYSHHRSSQQQANLDLYIPHRKLFNMASPIRTDWRSRFNTIVELFNRERFAICVLEAQTLLAHYNLPQYYRIRCLITLAQCEDDWYKTKVRKTLERSEKSCADIQKAPSALR